MKLWKSSILIVSLGTLLLASMNVSAVSSYTDPTGDVVHATWAANTWGYASIGGKSNIDITGVTADINDGKLTLTLTVVGPIIQSENNAYIITFNTSDANYLMVYGGYGAGQTGQNGYSWGIPKNGNFLNMTTGNVSLGGTNDNTLTTTLNLSGSDTTKVVLYATAYEYSGNPSENGEYWADVVGDFTDFQPTPSNGTSDGSKGTPGFEILPGIAAITIAVILLRRRR
jgi:hypothetical protein